MKKLLLPLALLLSVVALAVSVILATKPEILGAMTSGENWNRTALDSFADSQPFAASTTLLSVANPFSATTTLDFFSVNVTGAATSTYILNCGTSTSAYGTVAAPSDTLIDNITFSTGTKRDLVSASSTLGEDGFSAGTNSHDRIIVGANERVMCFATTGGAISDTAFTNVSSTFAGTYSARWLLNSN